jgi:hypothetical protein
MLFAYLRNCVYAQAEEEKRLRSIAYPDPNGGSYLFESVIQEEFFDRELATMRRLCKGLDYSAKLKTLISAIIDKTLQTLKEENEFVECIKNWNANTSEEIRTCAWGVCYVFSGHAHEILGIEINQAPLYFTDNRQFPEMCSYTPDPDKGESLADTMIFCRTDLLPSTSPEGFFSLVLHEKIHNLLTHFAYLAYDKIPLGDECLDADACLSLTRMKYRTGYLDLIPSLYFAECEEAICYAEQRRANEFFSCLIEQDTTPAPERPEPTPPGPP